MTPTTPPRSRLQDLRMFELPQAREAQLQRCFKANPEHFGIRHGEPPGHGEAHEKIRGLPAGWGFTRQWLIGYLDATDGMVAMANVACDQPVPKVWHIEYFLLATSPYGTGLTHELYGGLGRWMFESGAEWLRLRVVLGNVRAEQF